MLKANSKLPTTSARNIVYAARSLQEYRDLLACETLADLDKVIEKYATQTPATNTLRAASPNGSEKGPNEAKWQANYGCGFRTSPKMVAMFGLTGNRENMIGQMIALLESGKVIKTVTGYQFASGGGKAQTVTLPDDDGEETF